MSPLRGSPSASPPDPARGLRALGPAYKRGRPGYPQAAVDFLAARLRLGPGRAVVDGDAALAEVHRVLRPGCALALVWNRRRLDDPLNQALEDLVAPYRGRTSAFQTGAWRTAFERTKLFGPFEERVFPNEQSLDVDRLADRIASISFIATLDERERTRVLRRVQALAGPAGVTIHHDTEVQVADRLA